MISTVFRNGLSVFSIIVAGGLLAALLLMSGNPKQPAQRGIDNELRYLSDLNTLRDATIEATWAGDADTKTTLFELADRYELIINKLGADIKQVYAPVSKVGEARVVFNSWFGGFSRGGESTREQSLLKYTQLQVQGEKLTVALRSFGANQSHLVNSIESLDTTSGDLISTMRSRGNNEFADLLFGAEQTIVERLKSRNIEELSTLPALANSIRSPGYRMTDSDLKSLTSFANVAEDAGNWRSGMVRDFAAMDLSGFDATRNLLQENLATAYLQGLYAVNDARVLLNVYTVMLLLVLGYFGFRLSRSHKQLNQSHDELEMRVRQRTSDLETAMNDLTESQVQLVQAEKMSSLGQLVAGVMHEINTPLLYVLNNTSMTADAINEMEIYLDATLPLVEAKSEADRMLALNHLKAKRDLIDPEIISENAQEISELSKDSVEGLNQISELVQSLKDFSRLDRAAEDRFNVVEGLEKTLVITRNLWKYGIKVEKDFQEVPDIYCSPSRLNQIFINLITNAVQAMDGKGRMKISTSARGDWVEVSVQDSGCGIPEENLTKIMDPFFTTKPVGKGTGLGLSIVHQIVEEHEGQLLIDSKIGVGTRFTVGFPVRRGRSMQLDDKKTVSVVGSKSETTDSDSSGSNSGSPQTGAAA